MSDTPRLDAFCRQFTDQGDCADWSELYDFAAQLERELANVYSKPPLSMQVDRDVYSPNPSQQRGTENG